MAVKKSRAEQETIIRRAADEGSWDVFSEDPAIMRKLTRRWGEGEVRGGGRRWRVPRASISFRTLRGVQVPATGEQDLASDG